MISVLKNGINLVHLEFNELLLYDPDRANSNVYI